MARLAHESDGFRSVAIYPELNGAGLSERNSAPMFTVG